ncbi:MAG: sugar ABC transporter ATP-binding protein [Fimbriimonas sp.]|nr:sugar ABC transporter ATP-binding protein [Fimbriimonas sp.]
MAFGGVEVLKGVDLDLFPGEVHGIVGENGAGKSTLGKLIAGVHRATGGELEIGGSVRTLTNPRQALDLGVALIHQEPLTFPDLDVAENIFVGRQPKTPARQIGWKRMYAEAAVLLSSLGVSLNPRSKVRGLGVADQQMIELAAALSQHAKVLILDETTASLTPKEVAELFAIVRRLRDEGCAIAFVSHRLDEVFDICDRITILRDGEKVGERTPSASSIPEIVRLMVGRELASMEVRHATGLGGEMLSVQNLCQGSIFHDVSLTVRKGEIVGMAGLVGAGRTDVARAIFGITKPSAGEILVDGKPVQIQGPKQAMAAGLALVPEDRQHHGLLLPVSIAENASLAILRSLTKGGWVQSKRIDENAKSYGKKLNIVMRSVDQPVKDLSGGNQQKVVLSKWLASQPKVLILDEPTRGIDVGAKAEVHRLMRELADEGLAILMISSDLQEVLTISDRVVVMREGRLVKAFEPNEATQENVMLAATGQEAHAS